MTWTFGKKIKSLHENKLIQSTRHQQLLHQDWYYQVFAFRYFSDKFIGQNEAFTKIVSIKFFLQICDRTCKPALCDLLLDRWHLQPIATFLPQRRQNALYHQSCIPWLFIDGNCEKIRYMQVRKKSKRTRNISCEIYFTSVANIISYYICKRTRRALNI